MNIIIIHRDMRISDTILSEYTIIEGNYFAYQIKKYHFKNEMRDNGCLSQTDAVHFLT